VITSYSVRTSTSTPAATELIRLLVTHPAGGNVYTMIGRGAQQNFGGQPANTVAVFPERFTVHSGDIIGSLYSTTTVNGTFIAPSTNSILTAPGILTAPEGTALMTFDIGQPTLRLNLLATIEPDADHDGYGDETQDGCPGDRADHGPCTKPVISDFKFSLNKFAVDKNGQVLGATKAASGTTIIITLSKAAHVSFVMKLKATGRKVGKNCKKQTSKNAKNKKCTRYPSSYKFERDLPAGTSNLGFSGKIKVGSKTKTLVPGSYVATAYPFSIQSQLGGDTPTATFKVVAPAKKK
jgi:hypothetical protein